MSTGAITNGSASISTSATGCAGSVDSPATMVTPSAQRATATTTPSSESASVTINSARDRLGTATARPCRRPCCSVIVGPGSRDPGECAASVATTPPAISASTGATDGPAARNAPSGQTDAGKQRDRCEGGATLLENEGQLDGPEFAVGVRRGELCPAEVDYRLPQRAPTLRIGRSLGGRRRVDIRCAECRARCPAATAAPKFSPTSIRPLT